MTIGYRLMKLREECNLSRLEFAKVCKVNTSTIQQIENDKTIGHMKTWLAIKKATGCSLDEMVGYELQ